MRLKQLPPVIYHPSSILFIDDQQDFLEMLETSVLELQDTFSYKLFTDPINAIEFLNQNQSRESWLGEFLVEDDRGLLNFNIKNLLKRFYDKDRFEIVSVIFTDYKMPEKLGTDMLNAIKNPFIVRIILSGLMEPEKTGEAFNEQVMRWFLHKTADDINTKILKYAHEAQEKYFADLTHEIVRISPRLYNVLANQKFKELLDELVKEQDITDYCLADESGSYYLLQRDGKLKLLAVMQEDDIDGLLDMAKYDDKKLEPSILNAIQERKKFPFFHTIKVPPVDEWKEYLVDAKQINNTKIYYSIIEDLSKYHIDTSNIVSYSEYLKYKGN